MIDSLIYKKKDTIGKILLVFSILILIYMFIIPISTVYIHIDEIFTVNLLRTPFEISMHSILSDVHPPVYYLILMGFVDFLKFFNIQFDLIYASKIVSIIPYLLILLVSFIKLRKDYNWFIAGLFSFTIVTSGYIFYQFLTIRMYSWGLFFLVMSFIYLYEIYKKSNIKSWILFTIFSILSIYTHNILLISIGLLYLLLLAHIILLDINSSKKKSLIKIWFESLIILGIAYIPWISVLMGQMSGHSNGGTFKLIQLFTNLVGYATLNTNLVLSIIAFVFISLIIGITLYIYSKNKNVDNSFILTGILTFLLTYIIGSVMLPMFFGSLQPRYLVPAYGILWFSIVLLMDNIGEYNIKIEGKKIFSVLLVIILLMGTFSFINTSLSANDSFNEGKNEEIYLEKINNNNSVIIIQQSWVYTFYQYYMDKANIYLFKKANSNYVLHNNYTIENNTTKIIEDNPNKDIYLVTKKNSKINDSNIDYDIVGHRGDIYFYKIKIKDNTSEI